MMGHAKKPSSRGKFRLLTQDSDRAGGVDPAGLAQNGIGLQNYPGTLPDPVLCGLSHGASLLAFIKHGPAVF
jgi:hypothetical protein